MRTSGQFMLILTFLWFCMETDNSDAQNWPEFRGPSGNGHVDSNQLPLSWHENKNIAWKVSIHDRGWSSPIVWNKQVWVTTATRDGHQMFAVCVDLATGKLIHDKLVFAEDQPQPIAAENSYATPTPVASGNRVFVHFGTYGTACLDTRTGEKLWERRDLKCDHENGAGPASSPMIVDDMLVVHVDGRDVQYVIALDTESGRTVWKSDRSANFDKVPVNQRKAYSMPTVITHSGRRQLVSNGGKALYGYDPATGKEIWRVQHHGFSQAPRPVYGQGLIFTTIDPDNPELWGVRPDGVGDVTATHVEWKVKRAMPRRCSPLLVDQLLYLISRNGVVSCLEARTGSLIWRERLPGSFSASPIYANQRIYCFNDDAVSFVLKPGRELKVLATNKLNQESLMASPAVSEDSFIIRTEKHLYRVRRSKK